MPRDSLGLPGYAVIGSENAINKRLLFLGGDHHHKLSTQFKNLFFFNLFSLISLYLVISAILLSFSKRNCSTFSVHLMLFFYFRKIHWMRIIKKTPVSGAKNAIPWGKVKSVPLVLFAYFVLQMFSWYVFPRTCCVLFDSSYVNRLNKIV